MTRKYFGTDGVRGRVGDPPLTVDFAVNLASAAAKVLAPAGGSVTSSRRCAPLTRTAARCTVPMESSHGVRTSTW